MIWLIYAIIAMIVFLIVAIGLVWGDISIARYAARRPDSFLDARWVPSPLWLLGAIVAGAIIGALWPVAVIAIGVSRFVRARADSAARRANQPAPCSERRRSEGA